MLAITVSITVLITCFRILLVYAFGANIMKPDLFVFVRLNKLQLNAQKYPPDLCRFVFLGRGRKPQIW